MEANNALYEAVAHLGDNTLILGHRLGEWCGHGPVLEQDIAMTNISLDLIGQARMYLDYAGKLSGEERSEDDMAYRRDVLDFKNALIAEIPNGDYADTIARQFFFDLWHFLFLQQLSKSTDETLNAIAQKSLKEVTYHKRWSSEWVVRLGDGTEESKEKMQRAIDDVWMYTGELFIPTELDASLVESGILPDVRSLKNAWDQEVKAIIDEATLVLPEDDFMQTGGRTGSHTEYLGFILAEMQFLPRAYPDATW
ncbi:MAG: phenylacetate-CoA oxygenase subunit PaaC [Flavobacteriales bacterium]|nr:phenylacetate-CoA oxygenase subunit PaaC [Flavobacteriales bacterium]